MVHDLLTIARHNAPMRFAFLSGWVLLLVAFAAASAETIARTLPGGTGLVLSASELWQALWPGAFLFAKVQLGAAAPVLWDPLMIGFLSAPAWLLFGLPGVILAWCCRPGRDLSPEAEEEMEEHEASLFLYDDLAREARQWARDEGEDADTDDRLPSHELIDLIERQRDDDGELLEIEPLPDFVRQVDR